MLLLKIVQDILSTMDSDEVNSISDTIESEQIAGCVEIIYNQMISEYDLPAKFVTYRLDATDDTTNGNTRLYLPSEATSLADVQYDVRTDSSDPQNYKSMTIYTEEEFWSAVKNRDTSNSNIESQLWPNTTLTFGVYNDRAPSYCTLIEQSVLVFDAYDSDQETNLLNAKSMARGLQETSLILENETVIDLPKELLETLKSNARELAFDLYKGDTPRKVTDLARKGRVRQQRAKQKLRNQSFTGPNYGRNSAKGKSTVDSQDSGTYVPLPDYLKT